MSTAPEVSVVIPTRNRPDLAVRAAWCALTQEDVDLEVLVIDDASDVGELPLARLKDRRLRLFRNARRRGVAECRNRGIAEARGDWVAFLDDDDLWAPDKLARQLAAARSRPTALVHSGWVEVDGALRQLRVRAAHEAEDSRQEILEHNVCGPPSSVLVARETLLDAGGFDRELSVMADWDLWIRVSERGGALVGRPEPLVAYTVHQGGMHVRDIDRVPEELALLRAKHGEAVGGPRFLDWLAIVYRDAGRGRAAARLRLGLALRGPRPRELRQALGALLGATSMRRAGREEPDPPRVAWVRRWRAPAPAGWP